VHNRGVKVVVCGVEVLGAAVVFFEALFKWQQASGIEVVHPAIIHPLA
jgi:hypothetical protein